MRRLLENGSEVLKCARQSASSFSWGRSRPFSRLARVGAVLGILADLAATSPAHAVGASLGTAAEPPVVEARIAISVAPGQTTRWGQVRLGADSGAAAWLIPAGPGARVDEVSTAWLDALDIATAPAVGSPENLVGDTNSPSAGKASSDALDAGASRSLNSGSGLDASAQTAGARALSVEILHTRAALERFAQGWGFSLPQEVASRFELLQAQGTVLIAAVYPPPAASPVWTMPIRVTDATAPLIPLGLTRAGREAVRLTVSTLASSRVHIGAGPYGTLDPSVLACGLSPSEMLGAYRTARDSWLAQMNGARWSLECASPARLWSGLTGNRSSSGEGVVAAYLRLSASAEPGVDLDTCVQAASTASRSSDPFALHCPPGAFATVSAVSDTTGPARCDPAGTDATGLRCGRADDLALAFSGLIPSEAWITRTVGIIPERQFGTEWPIDSDPATPQEPIVLGLACTDGGVSTQWEPTTSREGGAAPVIGGGQRTPPILDPALPSTVVSDPPGTVVDSPQAHVATGTVVVVDTRESCSGSSAPPPESSSDGNCDGSQQPSEDVESSNAPEGCGSGYPSNSSSETSSESDSCSGSTEPEADEDYESDTTQSGCNSSTDPDYGDEDSENGCTPSASSDDDEDDDYDYANDDEKTKCAVGAPRVHTTATPRRRIRFSVWTLACAAIVLPIRRCGRRSGHANSMR